MKSLTSSCGLYVVLARFEALADVNGLSIRWEYHTRPLLTKPLNSQKGTKKFRRKWQKGKNILNNEQSKITQILKDRELHKNTY